MAVGPAKDLVEMADAAARSAHRAVKHELRRWPTGDVASIERAAAEFELAAQLLRRFVASVSG